MFRADLSEAQAKNRKTAQKTIYQHFTTQQSFTTVHKRTAMFANDHRYSFHSVSRSSSYII
jgi:hypothetical protein